MSKLEILIPGYAKKLEDGWVASSSVALIESNGKKIITDPGCNRQKLLEELNKRNLKTSDIDYVFLTHTHIDHTLLAGIFENAKIITPSEIYNNDHQTMRITNKIPDIDLEILETPGHTAHHCSLKITTEQGIYVIAGDVFWWTDGEEQKIETENPDLTRPWNMPDYVFNIDDLMKSRKKILEIADFIVPGHGTVLINQ
jgi:glyoxylase-like metal-dependent hydrolase (beta-lactamase superfamily II)